MKSSEGGHDLEVEHRQRDQHEIEIETIDSPSSRLATQPAGS